MPQGCSCSEGTGCYRKLCGDAHCSGVQGRPVIITRLVDSMAEAPRCTRYCLPPFIRNAVSDCAGHCTNGGSSGPSAWHVVCRAVSESVLNHQAGLSLPGLALASDYGPYQAATSIEASKIGFACRAEATDVANAVLDGVDGMLLGAETLRGKYPVETVRTVLAICRQAELTFDHEAHYDRLMARAMEVDSQSTASEDCHVHVPLALSREQPTTGTHTLVDEQASAQACQEGFGSI